MLLGMLLGMLFGMLLGMLLVMMLLKASTVEIQRFKEIFHTFLVLGSWLVLSLHCKFFLEKVTVGVTPRMLLALLWQFPLKCPIRKMLEPLQFRPGLRCQSRGRNPSLGLIPANSATHTISKAIKINGVEVNHTMEVAKAIHDSGVGSSNIREYSRPHSSSW